MKKFLGVPHMSFTLQRYMPDLHTTVPRDHRGRVVCTGEWINMLGHSFIVQYCSLLQRVLNLTRVGPSKSAKWASNSFLRVLNFWHGDFSTFWWTICNENSNIEYTSHTSPRWKRRIDNSKVQNIQILFLISNFPFFFCFFGALGKFC